MATAAYTATCANLRSHAVEELRVFFSQEGNRNRVVSIAELNSVITYRPPRENEKGDAHWTREVMSRCGEFTLPVRVKNTRKGNIGFASTDANFEMEARGLHFIV